ncbi:hypothetical protein D3C85_1429780 [compost metagenome]
MVSVVCSNTTGPIGSIRKSRMPWHGPWTSCCCHQSLKSGEAFTRSLTSAVISGSWVARTKSRRKLERICSACSSQGSNNARMAGLVNNIHSRLRRSAGITEKPKTRSAAAFQASTSQRRFST